MRPNRPARSRSRLPALDRTARWAESTPLPRPKARRWRKRVLGTDARGRQAAPGPPWPPESPDAQSPAAPWTRRTRATPAVVSRPQTQPGPPGYCATQPAKPPPRYPGPAIGSPRLPRPRATRRRARLAVSIGHRNPSQQILVLQIRQQHRQLPARVKEPRHDRADRAGHRFSDLFIFHVFKFMQHQHGAMLIRQLAHRPVNSLAEFAPLQPGGRVHRDDRHLPLDPARLFAHRLNGLSPLPLVLAQLVQAQVDNDSRHPRAETRRAR